MPAETANLIIKVESKGTATATRELDSLTASSDKAGNSATKAGVKSKQFGSDVTVAGKQLGTFSNQLNNASSALDSISADYNKSKLTLSQFLAEQVKAGRSIDENGNIITAHGVKAAKLSKQYSDLQREFVNTTNQADRLQGAMDTASLATDKNRLAVAKAADKQLALEQSSEEARQAIQKQISTVDKASKSLSKFNTGNVKTGIGTKDLGRKAGQASIQVEQLISSITAGANPAQAFAFQAADLGIVLGAPLIGSIVGVTAALSGPLINSLIGSTKATELLEKATEKFEKVARSGKDGVVEYTDELKNLAKISKAAATVRIDAAILNADDAVSASKKAIIEQLEDELDLDSIFFDLSGAVKSAEISGDRLGASLVTGVSKSEANAIADSIGKKFGKTGDEARKLGVEVVNLIANIDRPNVGGASAIQDLEEKLGSLATGAGKNKDKMTKLVGGLAEFFDAGNKAAAVSDELKVKLEEIREGGDLDFGGDDLKDSESQLARMRESLNLQIVTLNEGAQAAEVYALKTELVGTANEDQIPALTDLINKKYELKASQEASAEAIKKAASAQRLATSEIDAAQSKYDSVSDSLYRQIVALDEGEKAAYSYGIAQQLGLDSIEQIPDAIQAQIDKLYELKEAQEDLGEADFWGDLKDQIRTTSEDFDALWGGTFDRFAAGIGESTATAILEQQSFGDAAREIARGAISSLIAGLVEIGVKKVALFALENTLLATSTAANTAAAVTQGSISASAWAPAAAFASLATGGANAVPASAGLTATVGLAETLALAGSFEGGGYIPNGPRAAGLDGRGGQLAMVHPNESIIDHNLPQNSAGANGNISMSFAPVFNGSNSDEIIPELKRKFKQFSRLVQSVNNAPR